MTKRAAKTLMALFKEMINLLHYLVLTGVAVLILSAMVSWFFAVDVLKTALFLGVPIFWMAFLFRKIAKLDELALAKERAHRNQGDS